MSVTQSKYILIRPVAQAPAQGSARKNIAAQLMLPILSVMSIQSWAKIPIGNKMLWLAVTALLISYCLLVANSVKGGRSATEMKWLRIYLLYNALSISYGAFVAESYWNWRNLLDNGFVLLVPIAVYLAFNASLLKQVLHGYVALVIPSFFLYFPFITPDGYGLYLGLIPIFLLALPFLSQRWRAILLLLTIVVVVADPGARSNVIRFTLAILFIGLYWLPKNIVLPIIKICQVLFFVTPVIFFTFAISGAFNIFNMEDYLDGSMVSVTTDQYGTAVEEDLKADTRTELYREVLESAKNHNSWWFGRTPAFGHDTKLFAEEALLATGRNERAIDEVGILNVFTWTGIVGVLLYTTVLFFATSAAIHRSANMFCRITGLFISFRWAYSWVEEMNTFSINYLGIWLAVGICLSTTLRRMDDAQFQEWIRDVFYMKPLWRNHAKRTR